MDEISFFSIILLTYRNFTRLSGCYEWAVISKIKPHGFQIPDMFSLDHFNSLLGIFHKSEHYISCVAIFFWIYLLSLSLFLSGMAWFESTFRCLHTKLSRWVEVYILDIIITLPADVLAPDIARLSAGIMLNTMLDVMASFSVDNKLKLSLIRQYYSK